MKKKNAKINGHPYMFQNHVGKIIIFINLHSRFEWVGKQFLSDKKK